jgi:hypothetical protein
VFTLLRAARRDLAIAATVVGWIGAVLLIDAVPALAPFEIWRQVALGVTTWAVLVGLLLREPATVRAQTAIVVALATTVEYTFSPLLQAYVYRIGTVPLFVPPGHGMVYLAALALGRSALFRAAPRTLVATTVAGSCWRRGGTCWGSSGSAACWAFWPGGAAGCCTWGRSAWSATSSCSAPTWAPGPGRRMTPCCTW